MPFSYIKEMLFCSYACLYRSSKKLWPILYSKLRYNMGHYFLDMQYLRLVGIYLAVTDSPVPMRFNITDLSSLGKHEPV